MGGIELLQRAHQAGLEVWAAGDRLLIRGPKRLERLAYEILDRKAEMLPLLALHGDHPTGARIRSHDKGSDGTADPSGWARRAAHLLSGVADPHVRTDLRELFEHRAAIGEFDGRLTRTEAERMAFEG